MAFCQDHWDRLRAAIAANGLSDLVAPDGGTAIARQAAEIERGEHDATTFDPLMAAHWAIFGNVLRFVERAGGTASLYLLSDGPEDPVGLPGGEGMTWPRCPLCYIGLAHELTCKEPRCRLPKQDGYAWMINRAADDALAKARELGLRPSPDEGEAS